MKSARPLPPLEILKRTFEIDPESPSGLKWKFREFNEGFKYNFAYQAFLKRRVGNPVGQLRKDGRWKVTLEDVSWYVHRIIYALFTNSIDIHEDLVIDHIDQDPSNNRVENLRLVNHSDNMKNRKMSKRNKTGVRGVSLTKNKSFPFRTQIVVNWQFIQLGKFSSIYDARDAYEKAAKEYHGEFASFTTKEELDLYLENKINLTFSS